MTAVSNNQGCDRLRTKNHGESNRKCILASSAAEGVTYHSCKALPLQIILKESRKAQQSVIGERCEVRRRSRWPPSQGVCRLQEGPSGCLFTTVKDVSMVAFEMVFHLVIVSLSFRPKRIGRPPARKAQSRAA